MAKNESDKNNSAELRGEDPASNIAGTALITGDTFAVRALNYASVEGQAMFEGDISLGPVDEVESHNDAVRAALDPTVAAGVAITGHRWPGGRIPFEIAGSMPNQQRVTDAINHWHANTAIRLVARTTETDYVEFFDGGTCWSRVGHQGGKQQISLGPGCSTGNAIHEIGHTVGLWHEQSREDRDNFVTIQWVNIQAGMEHNFNQHIADGDDIGAYDYGSVMHYSATAFSRNGMPTIVPVQAGAVVGQRNGLSAGDIAAIRAMYPELYPSPFKKLRDDGGGVKKLRDDVGGIKKLRDDGGGGGVKKLLDDGGGVKKLRDDTGGIKKLRDDTGGIKKLRDDGFVKPPADFPSRPGPGEVVSPTQGAVLPFGLATGHQDPMAAAYAAGDANTGDLFTAYDTLIEEATASLITIASQLQQLRDERDALMLAMGL
ncbi:Dot/Icm T4SS effector Zinc-dependent metalloprotease LegP [Pseudarthrobacter sp. YS3]|uniref:Dot/Icm T4SS effector Zinc-dependent metalloprotease LegP n=1 Tax=Pseudarthrobacter sp. YS3 TaxID=3453718 RepID=UPI003EEC178B